MISALAAVGTFWVSVRRGSDHENRRTAEVAVDATRDTDNVVAIERNREADDG